LDTKIEGITVKSKSEFMDEKKKKIKDIKLNKTMEKKNQELADLKQKYKYSPDCLVKITNIGREKEIILTEFMVITFLKKGIHQIKS
jgi:hypothetical protein